MNIRPKNEYSYEHKHSEDFEIRIFVFVRKTNFHFVWPLQVLHFLHLASNVKYLSVERLPHEHLLPGCLVVDVVDADDVGHVLLAEVVVLPPPALAQHRVPEHLLRRVHPRILQMYKHKFYFTCELYLIAVSLNLFSNGLSKFEKFM